MKFILSGGGTGGHVNPALAIGEAIEKHDAGAEIHYVGTPKGIENKLVPEKYPMHHIEITGLKRSLSIDNLKTLYLVAKAKREAKKLLKELRPDAVIGTGGYVCWPICAAAAKMKIPCFLHESNAVPGFAVKTLKGSADAVFVNFDKTREYLNGAKRVVHVGTPLKSGFYEYDRESARRRLGIDPKYKKIVLSFGGSLGAAFLNSQILALMEEYGASHPDTLFIHATGAKGYDSFIKSFKEKKLDTLDNLLVMEYIYDMPVYMSASDLIISRSGAMTLSEIAVLEKPSILIPSPNVTNDQQTKNARLLSDQGAAVLMREADLTPGALAGQTDELLGSEKAAREMAQRVSAFAVKNAEDVICSEIFKTIEEKRNK